MKASPAMFGTAAVLLATTLAVVDAECADPVQAVMDLLECVADEDGECAAAAYDPGFQHFHNGELTAGIPVDSAEFWEGAFNVVIFSFDIGSTSIPEENQASVTYVEEVVTTDGTNFGLPASSEYPFGVTVLQHEHALIDVDDDCKILVWDQYGNNAEQTDVIAVVADLLCAVGEDTYCADP